MGKLPVCSPHLKVNNMTPFTKAWNFLKAADFSDPRMKPHMARFADIQQGIDWSRGIEEKWAVPPLTYPGLWGAKSRIDRAPFTLPRWGNTEMPRPIHRIENDSRYRQTADERERLLIQDMADRLEDEDMRQQWIKEIGSQGALPMPSTVPLDTGHIDSYREVVQGGYENTPVVDIRGRTHDWW